MNKWEEMESDVLTVREAASYLRCHPITVSRLLRASVLPGAKVGGRWKVFLPELNKQMKRKMAENGYINQ